MNSVANGKIRERTEFRDVFIQPAAGDNGTRDLLMKILKDEEDHEDWNEAQEDQIGQMGLENYLAMQIDGGS